MHGHMLRCTVTCYDTRSLVTMYGHVNVKVAYKFNNISNHRRKWTLHHVSAINGNPQEDINKKDYKN